MLLFSLLTLLLFSDAMLRTIINNTDHTADETDDDKYDTEDDDDRFDTDNTTDGDTDDYTDDDDTVFISLFIIEV